MLSSSSGYDNTKYFDLVRKQHPVVLTPNAGSIPHYRCIDYLKRIVSRDEWGALPPKDPESLKPLQYPTPFVMFTFTNTEPCSSYEECSASCRQMQKDSIDQGLPDIPFNFMLGDDLNVYEGRGWDIQPHEDWEQFEDKKERILNIAYIGVNELERFPKLDVMHVRDALIMYGFRHNYIDIRYFRRPRYDEDYEVPLNIYTREMWGAIPPQYEKPLKTPVRMWMFVWSNTKTCRNKKDCMQAMRELQMRDMYRQGMPDIQYK
ncbi:peptidoglycan recognition protein 3-like [Macrosteles quadrilineatus]|uniref:peptidoglycan recognition protein 3-like n=1 Tax=Macrosteles quadrilineatus TaxID=74068 RepID=UPI0023E18922|nr:peptidoglycan recognition protein 3-like [Macrosteles quadrilineatus]